MSIFCTRLGILILTHPLVILSEAKNLDLRLIREILRSLCSLRMTESKWGRVIERSSRVSPIYLNKLNLRIITQHAA